MKNQIIALIFFGLLFSSCGTTTHYASSSYEDAIYYNPSENRQITLNSATNDELIVLKNKTQEIVQPIKDQKVQNIIYMDSSLVSDSLVSDSLESYEDRLCKFDSPYYVININIVNGWGGNNYWNDPWYSGYYNPWYYGHHGYNSWYGQGYGYGQGYRYGGYGYGPYDWYYSPYYSYWNSPWYNPWYGGMYGYNNYGYYGYYGGYYGYYQTDSRDNYYGRRIEKDASNYGGREGARSGGSYLRKEAIVEQIRGERLNTTRSESSTPTRTQNIYRRDPATGSSGTVHNTDVVRSNSNTNFNTNRGTTYQRGNPTTRTETPVYRKSTQSSTANSNTRSTSYERSNTTRTQNYAPPVTRSTTSGNTNSSSGSGSSDRSSSGSGSTYRR